MTREEGRAPTMAEQEAKKAALELLIDARWHLIDKHPFIGALAMRLDIVSVVDCRLDSALTDGSTIFVDAQYCSMLNDEQRVYILAHEVWHSAMKHFLRRGEREVRRFNYACDIETDLLLRKDGFSIVDLLPYDDEWDGQNAEWIYERVPEFLANIDNKDQHGYPQEKIAGTVSADDKESEPAENGEGGGDGKYLYPEMPPVKHDNVFDPDFRLYFDNNLEEYWDDAVRAEASRCRQCGNLPGHFENFVEHEQSGSVDWRRVLADCVTMLVSSERQWIPPNRRFVHKKLYLPSRSRRQWLDVVVAIDTSGSTADCYSTFMTEIFSLLNSFGDFHITLIECDTRVTNVREITNDDMQGELRIPMRGGGGTDLCPPFDYVRTKMYDEPAALIYLTDGEGSAPDNPPGYPVIWCLTADGTKPADWGTVVKMS